MVALSPTSSTGLALLQQSQRREFNDPQGLFETSVLSLASGDAGGQAVLDVFGSDTDIQAQFLKEFDRLKKEHPGISDANASHNAMYEVITKNRDRFPDEAFAIYTELPGGGSVTTLIPPKSGHSAAFAALESAVARKAADRAIEAQIADAMSRAEETGIDPPDPQEIRDRLMAQYGWN